MRFARTIAAALAAFALCLPLLSQVDAQRLPPHRVFGRATLNGYAPPVGTRIEAYIGATHCGSGQTTSEGRFVVDIDHMTTTPGCGMNGASVSFRLAGIAAAPTASFREGNFEQLDLTATGVTGGARTAALDLSDPRPCIPASGRNTCDEGRLALWNGNRTAWAAEKARQGHPAPSDDDVFIATYEFRIGAGDPAAIASVARGLGWPYLQVTRVLFAGAAPGQADEYVEIANLGGASQDMTDWALRSPARNTVFRFPSGLVLTPGRTCRVYTGAPGENSCTSGGFNQSDVWPDDAGRVLLQYEPLTLVAADIRYSADQNNQPPAPHLQAIR